MDGDAWYYASGSEHKGPVSADQMSALFSSGAISGETLVWTQKLPDWTLLRETTLAPRLAATATGVAPPPLGPRSPPAALAADPGQQTPAYAGADNFSGTDFIGIVKRCFAKFVTWRGRADRSEFWYFFLFTMGVSIVASILTRFFSTGLESPALVFLDRW